ncbi:MAG: SO_0444 family Cu/Zn efflux transporter [Candidatus Ancaeobacter aquaticus]|nr:SO_0444 family Cu/Zn efflux transporter [Candidatus Ancaeobacter aquaticus]
MEEIVTFLHKVVMDTAEIFNSMSPFLLLGLFFAGIIHVYVPTNKIGKSIGKKTTSSVTKAALWGIPLPLCSCGVIPAALSLRKHGASKGATLSFLVSTPETGVDSIAITYSLLDPLFTIFRPVAAFVTAMTCGIAENFFSRKEKEEEIKVTEDVCRICNENEKPGHSHSPLRKIWRIFEYGYIEFLGDIGKWLFIGIIAAGMITAIIPEGFFTRFIGQGFLEMIIMLIAGIPLYICASATTPIAASLIVVGVSPGAALVFLLSGPATNLATLTVVWKYIGKKSAVIYLLSIAVTSLLMGLALNFIYSYFDMHVVTQLGKHAECIPHSFRVVCSIILCALIVIGIGRGYVKKEDAHEH